MRIESIPKSGRVGDAVYANHPHWKIKRKYARPRDPRSPNQLLNRSHFSAVSKRRCPLTPEQQAAWRIFAANHDFVTDTGDRVRVNCYHLFVSLNTRRADLGLPQFVLPPAEPLFRRNPVAELVITYSGGKMTLKLRVLSPPAQYTLVQGPAPKRSGVRLVQHFPFLGLLPPPIDGWSDITDLYVARYGVPKVNQAVWIRTCQHIDGWVDKPIVTRFRVPPATP